MSEPLTHPYSFGLPTGGRLDQEADDRFANGVVANICTLPRATPQRVEAARRNVREIPDERLDRSVDPWRDRETGEEFELVRSFFNVVDPAASGAIAFTVHDGWIVGLRSAGYEQPATSVFIGNMIGGLAS